MTLIRRRRVVYLSFAARTMAIGLLVHLTGLGLGTVPRDFIGDALWAVMMLWLVSCVAPGSRSWMRAAGALAICFAVETSQLYHSPAIDAARETWWGRLSLGSGFDPRDLVAYSLGILLGLAMDRLSDRRTRIEPVRDS